MPPRICIIPTDTDTTKKRDSGSGSAETETLILSLPHPRTACPTRYLLHPTRGLFEFTKLPSPVSSDPRSWLLARPEHAGEVEEKKYDVDEDEDEDEGPTPNDWLGTGHVISDGGLYIATSIDPLLLLLPYLLPADTGEEENKRYLPIDDLLDSLITASKTEHWGPILAGGKAREQIEARLRSVCGSVGLGGAAERAYKFEKERMLKVLAGKVERMAKGALPKSLEEEFVEKPLVKPIVVVIDPEEGDKNGEDKKEKIEEKAPIRHLLRLRVASRFLTTSYLPEHLSKLLETHLSTTHDFSVLDTHLASLKTARAAAASARIGDFTQKREHDDEAADERAEKKQKKEEEEKKKKKNVTRGVKELSKVNTRGMAKMTSFFAKKT